MATRSAATRWVAPKATGAGRQHRRALPTVGRAHRLRACSPGMPGRRLRLRKVDTSSCTCASRRFSPRRNSTTTAKVRTKRAKIGRNYLLPRHFTRFCSKHAVTMQFQATSDSRLLLSSRQRTMTLRLSGTLTWRDSWAPATLWYGSTPSARSSTRRRKKP